MLEPIFISTDLKKKLVKVSKFPGLLPSLVLLLKTNGIKRLFPVQKEVMSFMFESFCKNWVRPRDVCVCAPTGSGKTLAYVLPIIQVNRLLIHYLDSKWFINFISTEWFSFIAKALHGRVVCNIKALIVLPVTDLAIQVYEVFLTYCKGSGLQVCKVLIIDCC